MDMMKLLKSKENIEQVKDAVYIINKMLEGECEWSINPRTGLIDVDNSVNINGGGLKSFGGLKFGVVNGDFDCSNNHLTSLIGAPKKVDGCFDCSDNELTSLLGSPKSVEEYFDCCHNNLTSLIGAPQNVGKGFYCRYNKLTSLEGAPKKVVDDFDCSYNKLKSLEGAPQEVEGEFECSNNPLTSLKGISKGISDLYCSGKDLINLEDLPLSLDDSELIIMGNPVIRTIAEIMLTKKISFFGALCLAKDEMSKYKFNKICKINGFKVKNNAIKTYSIISRYSSF